MPKWRFRASDLYVVHLGNRHIPRAVRVFKEFAVTDAHSHASDLKPLKFQRMDDGCAEAVLSQMLRAQSR